MLGQLDVTAEATAYGGVLALRALIVIACFALHSAAVDPDDLLRAFRRISFRSALTAALATRMVPVLARDARRLHDAQRCWRASRRRGARSCGRSPPGQQYPPRLNRQVLLVRAEVHDDHVMELVVTRIGERDRCSSGRQVGVEEVVTRPDAASVRRRDHGVVITLADGQRHCDDVIDRRWPVKVGGQVDPGDVLAGIEGCDRGSGCS